MSDKSILDQIISNHQAEEVANLDATEIVDNLLAKFSSRERDVLTRRFGLHGQAKETLEKIGQVHQLTRERIRQIETSGIKKLRQLNNLEDHIKGLKKVIIQLLEEHGGLMERQYLLDNLIYISAGNARGRAEDIGTHKSHLDFLITKLLDQEFEHLTGSEHFKNSFKLKHYYLDHLETLAEELLEKVRQSKLILLTEDIIKLVKDLNSYKEHQPKFELSNTLDISSLFSDKPYQENSDLINQNKAIYSVLQAARKLEQNKFGYWGLRNWREINPKTINDKIYLVLKHHKQPLHFAEIADRINQIGFDNKKANPATVHNELILDNKYILVGRGLYGLHEWGYQKGTVIDIIENILASQDAPISRDEIINQVLEQRFVKKATVILALMNKDRFERLEGGYRLRNRQQPD